jgi:IclR family pca regulon transcriptional regulator
MGRVLLAAGEPAARRQLLRRVKLQRYTEHTITDRKALAAELEAIRRQGYAIVDQELELGLRSCAVPVKGPDGRIIAALNVGVHASRADAAVLERQFVPRLRRAADEIAAGLGGTNAMGRTA